MGLFSYDFYGGGRGEDPDAPRKRGLARLWEIFTRDSLNLLGAGALAMLSAAVYAAGMMISIDSHGLIIALIAGPLGGMLAAPQLCGLSDTILRSLRDEYRYWWDTYRRAWKRNAKGTLLPGAIGGLLFGFQLFILAHVDVAAVDLLLLAVMLLGVTVSTAIATWLLPQLALMDLPLHHAILNAVLLSIRHPLKTLGATLLQLVYWAFIVLSFPDTLALFFLLNFWLPMLIATLIIYEPLDETFHIEEKIEAINQTQYTKADSDPS